VAALAVGVHQEGDVGAAVRVVLEPLHLRRDPVLVVAAEIDDAVVVLVAAALVARGDVAHGVPARALVQRLDERRVRRALVQVRVHHLHHRPASGRGGLGLDERHLGHPFHEVDVAVADEAHVRLLDRLATADEAAMALFLALHVEHVHGAHLDLLVLEEELHRGLDLGLGRVGQHLEDDLLAGLAHERRLLGDHGAQDHPGQSFLVHASASSRDFTAAREMSTFSNRMRLTGSAWRASSTSTLGRLREASRRLSSILSVRMSTSFMPSPASMPASSLVLGCWMASPSMTERRSSRTSCDRIAAMPARYILRFTFCEKFSSGLFGKMRPPPRQSGEDVMPARARPVPFWRHGFLVEWRTSLLVFCAREPWRPLAW